MRNQNKVQDSIKPQILFSIQGMDLLVLLPVKHIHWFIIKRNKSDAVCVIQPLKIKKSKNAFDHQCTIQSLVRMQHNLSRYLQILKRRCLSLVIFQARESPK